MALELIIVLVLYIQRVAIRRFPRENTAFQNCCWQQSDNVRPHQPWCSPLVWETEALIWGLMYDTCEKRT